MLATTELPGEISPDFENFQLCRRKLIASLWKTMNSGEISIDDLAEEVRSTLNAILQISLLCGIKVKIDRDDG